MIEIKATSLELKEPSDTGLATATLRDIEGACENSFELSNNPDIAALNLLCAKGLPGAEELDVQKQLNWLDCAAEQIRLDTARNYWKFIDNPARFERSPARFCLAVLVAALRTEFGVKYNPKWQDVTPNQQVPDKFGADSRDVFIHAIIDGIGGTCGSLPVINVAVGRRLGYPLKLVKAMQHLFVRWDDPNSHAGERFNLEGTGPGIDFLTDDQYRRWPRAIHDADVDAGIYLKSLTPREELAEFMATRGRCLRSNGQFPEAIAALGKAAELAPHNHYFAQSHESLQRFFRTNHSNAPA